MINDWEKGPQGSKNGEDPNDPIYLATQAVSDSRAEGAASVVQGPRQTLRARGSRKIILDSSSDVEAEHTDGDRLSIPTLASSRNPSPDEGLGPQSPLAEIFETQQHQAGGDHTITVCIPTADIDKADYESIRASQLTQSQRSPAFNSSVDVTPKSLTSAKKSTQSTKSLSSQGYQSQLTAAHNDLFTAIDSPAYTTPKRIDVPASSETHKQTPSKHSTNSSLALIVRDSSSAKAPLSQLHSQATRPSRIRKSLAPPRIGGSASQGAVAHTPASEKSSSPKLLSSAQPVSQAGSPPTTQPQALDSIPAADVETQSSPPWEFQSQFPVPWAAVSEPNRSQLSRSGKSGPRRGSFAASEFDVKSFTAAARSSQASREKRRKPSSMDAPAVRQSPRLRAATPVTNAKSPQLSTLEVVRARSPLRDDAKANATSPLARSQPQVASYGSTLSPSSAAEPPTHRTPNQPRALAEVFSKGPALPSGLSPQISGYDTTIGMSALPIQQSIEEEVPSSADEPDTSDSKNSSSQQSLHNEREVPQVDGLSLPLQLVLGPAEYAIALPAEGKIQSAYTDTINAKKKTILKFIHRAGSVLSGNGSPRHTHQRNEMNELIDRLHDTTTHFDLGLPGFATQYSIRSEQAMKYALYAGSKFMFLGYLIDMMKQVECSIVIASKAGPVQDLIYDFLKMKHVRVQRHNRPGSARSVTPEVHRATLKIDLVSTTSDLELHLSQSPILVIAFDCSFDNQSPQIRRIRELNSHGRDQLLPVVHLLVNNSSEHIDRCLRKAMPSPQRLKVLVRATYQAKANLGGLPTYVPHPSDEPVGRQMDLHDLQRGVRKSPSRKMDQIASLVAQGALSGDFERYWTLGPMPDVQYDELDDTPPKISRAATGANTAAATPRDARARSRTPISRARSKTPVSRAGTPSGKKRLLDVDNPAAILAKRPRLTPMRDATPVLEAKVQSDVHHLREQLKSAQSELAVEKDARAKAEESLVYTKQRLEEWTKSHADMLRRYEKRREEIRKFDRENKRLKAAAESNKTRAERTMEATTKLKEQVTQLKTELSTARDDLKKEGGDITGLEEAREETRGAKDKAMLMERSLENTKRDFEFTRQQYQDASNRAAELATSNIELEEQVEKLKILASDEKRRLHQMNINTAQKRDQAEIEKLELEKKGMSVLIRKMEEEIKTSKKGRTGVQTRGSSAQPTGSPSVHGTRSRQGSPAISTVMSASRDAREALHGHGHAGSGARDPVNRLRNEG